VVPKDTSKVIVLKTDDLRKAVERVITISSEKSRAVKFDFFGGRVNLSTRSMDGASAFEEMAVVDSEEIGEGGITVGFNGGYVLKMLAVVDGDEVSFRSDGNAASPVLVVDPADLTTRHILMPLRI